MIIFRKMGTKRPNRPNNQTQQIISDEKIVVICYMFVEYVTVGMICGIFFILLAIIIAYLVHKKYLKPRRQQRRQLMSESRSPFYYSSESDAELTLFNGQESVQLSSFGRDVDTSSLIVSRSLL